MPTKEIRLDQLKVRLGLPMYQNAEPETWMSVLKLCMVSQGALVPHRGAGLLPATRNSICEATTEDYLMFVDSDMVFEPDDFFTLLVRLKEDPHMGAVSGLYLRKQNGTSPVCGWEEDGKFRWPGASSLEKWNSPVPVDYAGAGFLLITKEALDKVGSPWFWFEEDNTEDVFFFRRLREEGFQPHVDFGVRVGHIGKREHRAPLAQYQSI